jgi:AraC-like DNA-binding protein
LWESAEAGCAAWTERSMAIRLGIRPDRLSRQLHKETGLQFRQWRWGAILRLAVRELAASDASEKEIAGWLGYREVGQFARDVKRVFGLTPGALRKVLRRSTGAA